MEKDNATESKTAREEEEVEDSDDIEGAMGACPYNDPFHFHHDGCPACTLSLSDLDKERVIKLLSERAPKEIMDAKGKERIEKEEEEETTDSEEKEECAGCQDLLKVMTDREVKMIEILLCIRRELRKNHKSSRKYPSDIRKEMKQGNATESKTAREEEEEVEDSDDIEGTMEACPYNEPFHFHHDGCPACCLSDIDKEQMTKIISESAPKEIMDAKGKERIEEEDEEEEVKDSCGTEGHPSCELSDIDKERMIKFISESVLKEIVDAKGKERVEEEEETTESPLKEALLLDFEEIKECAGCQELLKVVAERDAGIFKILSCMKEGALKQSQVIEEMIRLQKEKEAFYFEWLKRNYPGIDETQK